ncbi:hypothetical protein WKW50_23575 [Ochrobactrum sp. GPK 3]
MTTGANKPPDKAQNTVHSIFDHAVKADFSIPAVFGYGERNRVGVNVKAGPAMTSSWGMLGRGSSMMA